jgi:hypothetical protein
VSSCLSNSFQEEIKDEVVISEKEKEKELKEKEREAKEKEKGEKKAGIQPVKFEEINLINQYEPMDEYDESNAAYVFN